MPSGPAPDPELRQQQVRESKGRGGEPSSAEDSPIHLNHIFLFTIRLKPKSTQTHASQPSNIPHRLTHPLLPPRFQQPHFIPPTRHP